MWSLCYGVHWMYEYIYVLCRTPGVGVCMSVFCLTLGVDVCMYFVVSYTKCRCMYVLCCTLDVGLCVVCQV